MVCKVSGYVHLSRKVGTAFVTFLERSVTLKAKKKNPTPRITEMTCSEHSVCSRSLGSVCQSHKLQSLSNLNKAGSCGKMPRSFDGFKKTHVN